MLRRNNLIKIHLQIHKLEEIHEVNKNSNLNLMFGFFEKTLQILILHTQLVAHTSPPATFIRLLPDCSVPLIFIHLYRSDTTLGNSLGSNSDLSGKNVLGTLKVDILKFLHCLGIGNNHRVVLRSGLLFCLWLFPLSWLCGHNVSSSPFSAHFYLRMKYK